MSRGIYFNYRLLYTDDYSLYVLNIVNTPKTLPPYISNKDQL